MIFEDDGSDPESAGFPSTAEVEQLHSSLTTEERDELLQCLLIAAPRGGEAMIRVLENVLLCHATEELIMERKTHPHAPANGRLFDAYLMVDWSASSVPKKGKDSIWYCLIRDGMVAALANPSTRSRAVAEIETILLQLVKERCSVLVGFDFPYSYPAGLSASLGLGSGTPPWRAIWQQWSRLVEDEDTNHNERFVMAAELNRRLSHDGRLGPFWGCPRSLAAASGLSTTRPRTMRFRERRLTEERVRRTQPAWKLCYPGSVGSQALLGIPRLEYLRTHPQLAPVSRVWPFEWDESVEQALREHRLLVLHAEVYPSLIKVEPGPGEVKDEVQVRELARFFAEKDSAGQLCDLLREPWRLAGKERQAVLEEEGWILGVAADEKG